MVSEVRGAVQQIKKYAKNSVHSPCSNHALNLSIAKSSTVQSVRNCVRMIKEVVSAVTKLYSTTTFDNT